MSNHQVDPDPQMHEYNSEFCIPQADLEETWFDGYFTITKRGDPLPLWWRFWAKIFFNYKWKRI